MVETSEANESIVQSTEKRVPNGVRKKVIWSFLLREKVGQEYFLTPEAIRQAAQEAGVTSPYVQKTLGSFEKKDSLIKMKSEGKGKGITITFLPPKKNFDKVSRATPSADGHKLPESMTLGQVIEKLSDEISALEHSLSEKRGLRAQLQAMVRR